MHLVIRNKSVIKKKNYIQTWLKYESCIHNIAFSSETIFFLSESGEKYAQVKQLLHVKTVQNNSKQMCWWIFVDYSDVFISCLSSYSDGTHSLQRIHW